jgi:hypothetical protein
MTHANIFPGVSLTLCKRQVNSRLVQRQRFQWSGFIGFLAARVKGARFLETRRLLSETTQMGAS